MNLNNEQFLQDGVTPNPSYCPSVELEAIAKAAEVEAAKTAETAALLEVLTANNAKIKDFICAESGLSKTDRDRIEALSSANTARLDALDLGDADVAAKIQELEGFSQQFQDLLTELKEGAVDGDGDGVISSAEAIQNLLDKVSNAEAAAVAAQNSANASATSAAAAAVSATNASDKVDGLEGRLVTVEGKVLSGSEINTLIDTYFLANIDSDPTITKIVNKTVEKTVFRNKVIQIIQEVGGGTGTGTDTTLSPDEVKSIMQEELCSLRADVAKAFVKLSDKLIASSNASISMFNQFKNDLLGETWSCEVAAPSGGDTGGIG